jgi:hypothetical protein
MVVSSPCYTHRETVKRAMDTSAALPRRHSQIDRLMQASARRIDQACNRVFYPTVDTRYFDWPISYSGSRGRSWEIWLDDDELISVSAVSAGQTVIPLDDVHLEPANSGPPYTRLEISLASGASFAGAPSWQRAVGVAGLYGFRNDETAAGAISGSPTGLQATLTVTDSSAVSPGALIRLDDERLLVTESAMTTTGVTFSGSLTAAATDTLLDVGASVSAFTVGETILLDAERMLIVDVSGTRLVVKRAWDGSVISAHAATPISAPRLLSVTRGALGTLSAAHTAATPIHVHQAPALVEQTNVGLTLYGLWAEKSGMSPIPVASSARTSTRGRSAESPAKALLADLIESYGRQARTRVI